MEEPATSEWSLFCFAQDRTRVEWRQEGDVIRFRKEVKPPYGPWAEWTTPSEPEFIDALRQAGEVSARLFDARTKTVAP